MAQHVDVRLQRAMLDGQACDAPVSCSTRKCTLLVTQERMAWGDNLRRRELPRQIGGRERGDGDQICASHQWRRNVLRTVLVSALKALSDGASKKSSTLLEVLVPLLRSSCSTCHARGLNLKGINRRKYYLRGISIKHGRGCKHGRPPTVGRYMCPTRKVRKGLACGWERDPHIRPDYTTPPGRSSLDSHRGGPADF